MSDTRVWAFLDLAELRIAQTLELPANLTPMPFATRSETPGPDQVLGSAEIVIEDGQVVELQRAVRALNGLVAILADDGSIAELRELGADPVQVADNVMRFAEVYDEIDPETEKVGAPVLARRDGTLVRTWPAAALSAEEIEARAAERQRVDEEAALERATNGIPLPLLLDMENRVRRMTGEAPLTEDAYRASLILRAGA